MKKLPLVLVTLSFIISISSFAQVAIGTDQVHGTAILQLESKEKGFLLPRMTNEERLKIDKPAVGLQIFVTDFGGTDKGMILFYNGSEWKAFKELSSRPNPPTNVTANRLRLDDDSPVNQATITFNTPDSNGSTITQYQVNTTNLTSGETKQSSFNVEDSNVGVSNEQTQILITDLQTNALYTFTVAAINAVDTSTQSDTSDIAPTPIEGDYLYGGVVFYILNASDPGHVTDETHGLICAPKDLDSSYPWSNVDNLNDDVVVATEYIMGTGGTNTSLIKSTLGNINQDYAAYQATLYRLNNNSDYASYSEWYLPSKHELNKMHTNKNIINTTLQNNGGTEFSTGNDIFYWSSSQDQGGNNKHKRAWRQNLGNGTSSGHDKTTLYKVRPIRSF